MINIKIFSPTGNIYDGNVSHVTFPGELGSFSVYPSHAPIISTLVKGHIVCFPPEGEKQMISIESGFVEVKENQITVCVEQHSEQNNDKKQNHG
ncbi:MAG: ATP synthase F1 subunit epsilon [Tannerella sp.]|jgi:F-type H+-transporting ATPase subunit epsilon|nr:ATP synthase F1 subunit epsilon [Tannerella sp.]